MNSSRSKYADNAKVKNVRIVNPGASPDPGGGSAQNAVKYIPQALNEQQKAQARMNIGSPSIKDVADVADSVVEERQRAIGAETSLQQMIAAIQGVRFVIVNKLPPASAETMGGKIYLVPDDNPAVENAKDEYVTIQEGSSYRWEMIGSTTVDIDGYVKQEDLDEAMEDVEDALETKQDSIQDLNDIRSGASAGATAYQKPGTGIPASDMASGVQTSLGKADSAYQKPGTGIPSTDMASGVQTSLSKAGTAYQKPAGGIPKADTDSGVQRSLELADSALQAEPVGPIIAPPETDEFATKTAVNALDLKVDDINKAVGAEVETTSVSFSSADDTAITINTSTLKWEAKPEAYNYMLLAVVPGAKYTIVTRSNRNCKATMLASGPGEIGDDVDFATGWDSVQTLSMNTTTVWTAPADAQYLYIQRVNNDITVSPTSISQSIVTSNLDPMKKAIVSLEEGKGYVEGVVDISEYIVFDYSLNMTTLKWGTGEAYKHTIIPTPTDAKKVYVKANANNGARIAWLDSYTVGSGEDAPITTGTTTTSINAGESVEITVPEGAKYMYVYLGQLTDGVYPYQPVLVSFSVTDTVKNVGGFNDKQAVSIGEALDILKLSGASDIDLSVLTRYSAYCSNSYTWTGIAYGKHIYIPVNGGDTVVIQPPKNLQSDYCFTTTIQAPTANGGAVDIVPGTVKQTILGNNTYKVVAPTGAKYICFTTGDSRYAFGLEGRIPSRVIVCPASYEIGSILYLNPDVEFVPKMMSATKRYYTSTDSTEPAPLVISHLSDIHANWDNVKRFLEFSEHHSDNIDLLLNTGDTVSSYYTDGIAGYSALDGAEKIMNVIGNHDTRGNSEGMAQWTDHIGTDAYNLLIKPFVSGWDVVQPEDAETNGYCYYYKDFATKKIRLVVVDIMAYDETENTWLAGVLAGASEGGLSVVIATHYAGVRSSAEQAEAVFTKVPCNYTTLYSMGGDSTNLTGYNTYAYKMMETVDAFMQDGGEFVGYIQGHYHADFVAKCAEYPSQLIFSIGATKAGEFRDYNHIEGTRFQDEFQIVAIDTKNTIVKLYKVGANIDRYGRKKGSICVDYSTGTVLGEGW